MRTPRIITTTMRTITVTTIMVIVMSTNMIMLTGMTMRIATTTASRSREAGSPPAQSQSWGMSKDQLAPPARCLTA
jgi:hypothetical protein